MNFNKFAQRVALLDNVIFNINRGDEYRDDQVTLIHTMEVKLPKDFHKRTLSQRTSWVEGAMRQFTNDNITELSSMGHALSVSTFLGSLILSVMKNN